MGVGDSGLLALTSLMLISASTYWSPFCRMEMRAAGGTSVPLMLDWLMWLSMPKVNAEWEKPEKNRAPFTFIKNRRVPEHKMCTNTNTNIQRKVQTKPTVIEHEKKQQMALQV